MAEKIANASKVKKIMRGVPSCLRRRYEAFDDLVRDLNAISQSQNVSQHSCCRNQNDDAVRLMCNFWNILKEDPHFDLTRAVRRRLGITSPTDSNMSYPQNMTCYMAGTNRNQGLCDKHGGKNKSEDKAGFKRSCCSHIKQDVSTKPSSCCGSISLQSNDPDAMPLGKVLVNLTQASSNQKKCNEKISELLETEKKLQEQIELLENREKEGVELLKQADCMWTCMEEAYKKKIAESIEKQKTYIAQLKDIDKSNSKWRKNKRDLEMELSNIDKVAKETESKINEKTNDLKMVNNEIADLEKRVENCNKDIESAKNCAGPKKLESEKKLKAIIEEIKALENNIKEERKRKDLKEKEGAMFVKDARDDLTKICKCVLQKKVIRENLTSEVFSLQQDIKMLNESHEQCREKCNSKILKAKDDLAKTEKEISEFNFQCIQCHKCVDTNDVKKYCTDCPKCSEERSCIITGDTCTSNPAETCVCMSVKKSLLDNVFENMYTVLAKQAKTKAGKNVSSAILQCLHRSQNGKLDDVTRRLVQSFIMKTIKKNLNLTIVGGAVKTRCEMDPETYNNLMSCLKLVKVVTVAKVDEGTAAKKEPCRRFPSCGECHCAKGPNNCICSRKAPPPVHEQKPCPPDKSREGDKKMCPHKEDSECGPDCGAQSIGSEVAQWRPDPCKPKTCKFPGSNMRAAQCTLGPEALPASTTCSQLESVSLKSCHSPMPTIPPLSSNFPQIPTRERSTKCQCGNIPCSCEVEKPEIIIIKDSKKKLPLISRCSTWTRCACTQCWITSDTVMDKNDDEDVKNEKNVDQNKTSKQTNGESSQDKETKPEISGVVEEIFKKTSIYSSNNVISSEDNAFNDDQASSSRGIKTEVTKKDIKKLSVKGVQDQQLSCFLRFTSSKNFTAVLDKEFEIEHRKSIELFLGAEKMLDVFLARTDSDNFILNVNEAAPVKNALVMITSSKNIKILLNDETAPLKRAPVSILDVASKRTVKNKRPINAKAQSDLGLFKSVEHKLEDKVGIFSKPSAKLHKTTSGQYAIILSKESRRNFINDLKKYLAMSHENRLPIERTESGEIKIVLEKANENGNFGSLKVTPSGGIYVIVEENLLKDIKTDASEEEIGKTDLDKYAQAFLRNQKVLNKSIATYCNAQPDSVTCDPKKCVCKQLKLRNCVNCVIDKECEAIDNGSAISIPSREGYCFGREEQCYLTQVTNPPVEHLNSPESDTAFKTYLEVAIELKQYSEACKKKVSTMDWDHLERLPHQLPYFLR